MFHLLGSSGNWLTLPPGQWAQDDGRRVMGRVMKGVVSGLSVVNDTAERGVKLIQEYAVQAQDSEQRGRMILVAQDHRIKMQVFQKNAIEEIM